MSLILKFLWFNIGTQNFNIIVLVETFIPHIRGQSDIWYQRSFTKYRVWYWVQYSKQPMAFIAEQKPSLLWLTYVCAEESQLFVPWIPAPSFCSWPHLAPSQGKVIQRSSHCFTSTCWFQTACSLSSFRVVLNLLQLLLGSYPWSSEELYWICSHSGSMEWEAHVQGRSPLGRHRAMALDFEMQPFCTALEHLSSAYSCLESEWLVQWCWRRPVKHPCVR